MSRQVICIGETVLDIIFKDGQPRRANPGGSSFNSSISLGRAGVSAAMVGETGDDRAGEMVRLFLEENGVNPSFMRVRPDMDTKVALAFLDANNDASYSFLGRAHGNQKEFGHPEIRPSDVILFGSFFAIDPVNREHVAGFLKKVREAGAIVYYDVNFRPSHARDLDILVPNILANMAAADIVRCSCDDVMTAFRTSDAEAVYRDEVSPRCRSFILTDGARDIRILDGEFRGRYPVEPVGTVSTIGAGDSFNAGIAYGLISNGIERQDIVSGLGAERWEELVAVAQSFSRDCCRSDENYISRSFGLGLR